MKIYKLKIYGYLVIYIVELDDETVFAEIYKFTEKGCTAIRHESTLYSLIQALEEEFKTEIKLDYLKLLDDYSLS